VFGLEFLMTRYRAFFQRTIICKIYIFYLYVAASYNSKTAELQIQPSRGKNVQPPADVLQRLAGVFDVSIDYLVNGNKSDKVEQTLKDAELIKQFKQLDKLPEEEKKSILKVIGALIRDFNARQAYAI